MKTLALIALILSGCTALLDDSDMARLEKPAAAYECAAFLAGVETPGPVPTVIWRDGAWLAEVRGSWKWVNGTYDPRTNTINVRRDFSAAKTMVHEMTHALQAHLGEPFNEAEAQKAANWIRDCINFMPEGWK